MRKPTAISNNHPSTSKLITSTFWFSLSVTSVYFSPLPAYFLGANAVLMNSAAAAAQDERRAAPEARQSQTISARLLPRIERIIELRENEQFAEARAILDELKVMHENGRLNDRETSTMWMFYASLDQAEDNFAGAIANYRQMLVVPNLAPEQLEQTWLLVGSLHLALEEFPAAIDALDTYITLAAEPSPDAYYRLASAHYQLEQYQLALEPLLRNMELLRVGNTMIPENTYVLLRALYLSLEDYENARQVIREMIVLFNSPDSWSLLAQIEGMLENFTAQAHTYYVANAADVLSSESQLVYFATQLVNNDNPFGCAKVIEAGMNEGIIEQDEYNLSLIAQCYQQAREDSLAAGLLEQAAVMSDSGELYNRLGHVYGALGEFEKAVGAFDDAIGVGGIGRPDQLYLSQANAYRELNRYDEAIEAARMAAMDERSSEAARNWISILTTEKERFEYFQQQRTELAQYFR